ncbi:DUF4225 domain-containing protein [Vibrio tubiashii]|uniref:DUF4225 domain-containing protein n=1 Tax=Vibrio tubiashii TaxID=29498 RepID=UPI00349EE78F
MNRVNPHDLWEVQAASKQLNMVASTLMNKHISNGPLKLKFSQSVARHGKCLVRDFEQGKKTKEQALKEIKKEQRSLFEQGVVIGQKGVGLVAGVMQTITGAATCYYSAMTLCAVYGGPLALHGVNNIYENGKYFIDGDEDATGYVRQFYQTSAVWAGFDESAGNMAYYGMDLAFSARAILGRSTTVKPPKTKLDFDKSLQPKPIPLESWINKPHAKQFKLYRYSAEDFLRGYQAANKPALLTGAFSDSVTLNSLYKESTDD